MSFPGPEVPGERRQPAESSGGGGGANSPRAELLPGGGVYLNLQALGGTYRGTYSTVSITVDDSTNYTYFASTSGLGSQTVTFGPMTRTASKNQVFGFAGNLGYASAGNNATSSADLYFYGGLSGSLATDQSFIQPFTFRSYEGALAKDTAFPNDNARLVTDIPPEETATIYVYATGEKFGPAGSGYRMFRADGSSLSFNFSFSTLGGSLDRAFFSFTPQVLDISAQ